MKSKPEGAARAIRDLIADHDYYAKNNAALGMFQSACECHLIAKGLRLALSAMEQHTPTARQGRKGNKGAR